MTAFKIHTTESAPPAARATLDRARQKYGFVPNLLGELAGTPAALNAYVTLSELLNQTSLSTVEQQVVLLAASMTNQCHYCVAAHTASLKMARLADDQIAALREGRPLADAKLEALRVFTIGVVGQRGWVGEADVQRFLAAGHTREQVFEVLLGVAMKTLSNYANHIAATPLDAQLKPFAWEATTA